MNSSRTNAILRSSRSETGEYINNDYHSLPNRRVLSVTTNEVASQTTLSVSSIDNILNTTATLTLDGRYDVVGVFPDGTFLLQSAHRGGQENFLSKMCSKKLESLSKQSFKFPDSHCQTGILDNDKFFVIQTAINILDHNNSYTLKIYEWINEKYIETCSTPFVFKTINGMFPTKILSLENNLFCCQFSYTDKNGYQALIFEIDSSTGSIKERDPIDIKSVGLCSHHKDNITALPNNQLLTYCNERDKVQIWDTNTMICSKEWNWKSLQKISEDNFTKHLMFGNVISFPDSIHILFTELYSHDLFIMNTINLSVKKIDIGNLKPLSFGGIQILANGKIIILVEERIDKDKKIIKHILIDTPEMIEYRKNQRENFHSKAIFACGLFNTNGLPRELTQGILGLAFKNEFVEEVANRIEEKQIKEGFKFT